jgi:hypothetical protein
MRKFYDLLPHVISGANSRDALFLLPTAGNKIYRDLVASKLSYSYDVLWKSVKWLKLKGTHTQAQAPARARWHGEVINVPFPRKNVG